MRWVYHPPPALRLPRHTSPHSSSAIALTRVAPVPEILLLDNGSRRPQSTLALRALAQHLAGHLGQSVQPVSLAHSDQVPSERLDGRPATTLEPWLRGRLEAGARDFLLLPLFFGLSAALTEAVPALAAQLRAAFGPFSLTLAPPLCPLPQGEPRLTSILLDRLTSAARAVAQPPRRVVMVDHGSPSPQVNAARRWVAADLKALLTASGATGAAGITGMTGMAESDSPRPAGTRDPEVQAPGAAPGALATHSLFPQAQFPEIPVSAKLVPAVPPASHHPGDILLVEAAMERRPGAQYDFNGELLIEVLHRLGREDDRVPVFVLPLFLFAGRHAGPGGDLATISATVQAEFPTLDIHLAGLVGDHPGLIDILASRYREASRGQGL